MRGIQLLYPTLLALVCILLNARTGKAQDSCDICVKYVGKWLEDDTSPSIDDQYGTFKEDIQQQKSTKDPWVEHCDDLFKHAKRQHIEELLQAVQNLYTENKNEATIQSICAVFGAKGCACPRNKEKWRDIHDMTKTLQHKRIKSAEHCKSLAKRLLRHNKDKEESTEAIQFLEIKAACIRGVIHVCVSIDVVMMLIEKEETDDFSPQRVQT